jgi:1-acyl-sn-glycerol-3-phosphate acyltransferase
MWWPGAAPGAGAARRSTWWRRCAASPDGTIGEFKDGAFIIAIASQVPIVPTAIHGTRRIWPPGRAAIHAGQVRVAAASPLPTTGLTRRDVAGLREQARDAICSAHRKLVTAMSADTALSGEPPTGRPGGERRARGFRHRAGW